MSPALPTVTNEPKPSAVLDIQVEAPPAPIATAFCGRTQNWFDRIAANGRENQTLATLRNTLLPKLISGEVRVREAEKAVAAVA